MCGTHCGQMEGSGRIVNPSRVRNRNWTQEAVHSCAVLETYAGVSEDHLLPWSGCSLRTWRTLTMTCWTSANQWHCGCPPWAFRSMKCRLSQGHHQKVLNIQPESGECLANLKLAGKRGQHPGLLSMHHPQSRKRVTSRANSRFIKDQQDDGQGFKVGSHCDTGATHNVPWTKITNYHNSHILWMFFGSTCYLLVKLFQVYNILRSAWLTDNKEALTSAVCKQIVYILEDLRNFYHTRLHQDDFSRRQQIPFLMFLLDNIIPNVWYVHVILPPSFSMTWQDPQYMQNLVPDGLFCPNGLTENKLIWTRK